MKVHVGSGTVYLDGWLNVDVPGPSTFLAKDRPDLVDRYLTSEDKYYARHQDKTQELLRQGPLVQEYVCDVYGDFAHLPIPLTSADEVLARHCFEHLSMAEARQALMALHFQLKPNGVLRIDIPDHEATLEAYRNTGDSFYKRHLFGPRRDERGYHLVGHDRKTLRALIEDYHFHFVEEEENTHFYPAFCLRFINCRHVLIHSYQSVQ